MVSQSRSIELISKLNPEVYKIINKDVYGTVEDRLGSVQGAVTRILTQHEQMLKALMPVILTTSVDDPSWYKKVTNYWHSFGITVPVGGKRLEIGFNFDFRDNTKTSNINDLVALAAKNKVTIDSDESLRDYVLKNVPEFEKYKYATPINVTQYLIWIFCLGHRQVAKQADSLEKSTNITMLLIDPKEIEDARKVQHTASVEAIKKYLEIISDRGKVKDILYVKGEDPSTFDDLDADAKLKTYVDTNPKAFLAIANDVTLNIKARIERYCVNGILRKLSDSSIIVDATDNSIVIGNTLDEAVAFFGSEAVDKVAKVKEFQTRYKQVSKV